MKHGTLCRAAAWNATHPLRTAPAAPCPADVIASTYCFERDDETTRLTFDGAPVQIGMRLTSTIDGDAVTVVYDVEHDLFETTDADSPLAFAPVDYILAVRERIAQNRARREASERIAQAA